MCIQFWGEGGDVDRGCICYLELSLQLLIGVFHPAHHTTHLPVQSLCLLTRLGRGATTGLRQRSCRLPTGTGSFSKCHRWKSANGFFEKKPREHMQNLQKCYQNLVRNVRRSNNLQNLRSLYKLWNKCLILGNKGFLFVGKGSFHLSIAFLKFLKTFSLFCFRKNLFFKDLVFKKCL